MSTYTKLAFPSAISNTTNKLLLHSCCAPCSSAIMETLIANNINYTIFFYNPNIYPLEEYAIRKQENMRFANKHNIPFIDADYEHTSWILATKHLANEPERGKRCSVCLQIRLQKTADHAASNDFSIFATSLGISRHKDLELINACGNAIAANYNNLKFWDINWRKVCSPQLMQTISKRENFYRQKYCGCIYSFNKKINNKTIEQ